VRATRRVELAIEVDSDPISGFVCNGTQHSQRFHGWIDLVAAIEAARRSNPRTVGAGETGRETLGSLPGAKPSAA
jgi:hypothetical protein